MSRDQLKRGLARAARLVSEAMLMSEPGLYCQYLAMSAEASAGEAPSDGPALRGGPGARVRESRRPARRGAPLAVLPRA